MTCRWVMAHRLFAHAGKRLRWMRGLPCNVAGDPGSDRIGSGILTCDVNNHKDGSTW